MSSKVLFTNEQVQDIIKMFSNKINATDIGKKYGVSRTPILRVLHDNGIEYRNHILGNKMEEEICHLYSIYKNQRVVGDLVGIRDSSVGRVLKRNNIDVVPMEKVVQKYTLNEYYFDQIDSHNKAYILGLICADGCITRPSIYGLRLVLQETDKHILIDINKEMDSDRPLFFVDMKKRKETYKNQYGIYIGNKHMYATLVSMGITPNKSLTLKYPNIRNEFQNSFIRGYFDGDGYLSKTRDDIKILGTESFISDMNKIIYESIGVCGKIYSTSSNDVTKCLEMNRKMIVTKFLNWIYQNDSLCLFRKKQIYLQRYVNNSLNK